MHEKVLRKRFNLRKVLKTVGESTFKEADNLVKNDDEQTLETLRLFQEVLKRKLAVVKTLEG